MLTSIKNNKRPRKSAINRLKNHGYLNDKNSNELSFSKTASKDLLKKIRSEAKRENRQKLLTYLIAISVLSVSFIIAIGFVKF